MVEEDAIHNTQQEVSDTHQGKQGDFKSDESSQMSAFQNIKQKLQQIGQANREEVHEESVSSSMRDQFFEQDPLYEEEEEESIIYKDNKIYDQPKKALYGIKKAKNAFWIFNNWLIL